MTDWMVDKEFHPVFHRVSETVDLKGAFTPDEIDKRLKRKIRAYDFLAKHKELLTHVSKKEAKREKQNLQKLIDADFGVYVIAQASRHPDGIVNLTLHHGKDKAVEILLERSRRLRRSVRMRRTKRKLKGGFPR